MTQGIYLLNFTGTHKVYVGQSLYIESRYKEHITAMQTQTHSKKMNKAYLDYGLPTLEIECICTGDMDDTENYYIKFWDAVQDGFNTLKTASGGTSRGEDNGMSIYSDKEYISILNYIVDNPKTNLAEISRVLCVSYNVVKSLALGKTQKWLEFIYPDKYAKLISMIGTRNNEGENQGASTSTNDQIIKALILQYESPTMPYHEVGANVGLSKDVVADICTGSGYHWLAESYPIEHASVLANRANKRSYSRSAAARGITYPPILSPEGIVYDVTNVNAFAKLHGLDTGSLNKVLNRKALSTKGWALQERKQP